MKLGEQTLNKKTIPIKPVPQVRPAKFPSYRDSLEKLVSRLVGPVYMRGFF